MLHCQVWWTLGHVGSIRPPPPLFFGGGVCGYSIDDFTFCCFLWHDTLDSKSSLPNARFWWILIHIGGISLFFWGGGGFCFFVIVDANHCYFLCLGTSHSKVQLILGRLSGLWLMLMLFGCLVWCGTFRIVSMFL